MKTGIANLPLHGGKAPRWLFGRMVKLAREITIYIVSEFGADDFINRLSNPFWFQSLGCVLGFDWHSSGLTTTTCGALKEGVKNLEKDLGLFICGGKGGTSRKTPTEIEEHGQNHSQFDNLKISNLIYSSKISAKVDNTALQDGYQLYHHNFFFTKNGNWAVVQQGMNSNNRMARRYHWLSDNIDSFVEEPQSAICCDIKGNPLNMVAKKSKKARKVTSEIAKDKPEKNLAKIKKIVFSLNLPKRHEIFARDLKKEYLSRIFLKTYQDQPENFESLLMTKGLGPKSLRALTLIAELIYGAKPSYQDPVRYSFAHGGKDGIPYPVNKKTYDKSVEVLQQAIKRAKLSSLEKDRALQRLLKI
jgi:hypothetical protein